MQIKLSEELKRQANNGYLKTRNVIEFIINNVEGTKTEKPITETALKDIAFNGKYPISAMYDSWKGVLHVQF